MPMPAPLEIPSVSEVDAARFWAHVFKTNKCWLWTSAVSTKGYGSFRLNGRTLKSNRVAWAIHHGSDPGDLFVCHTCDNRACVRPEHLFLGSNADNIKDMWDKGRRSRRLGESAFNVKLTEDGVREIRKLKAAGVHAKVIAKRFGIIRTHVYDIVNRVAWGHVP